MAIITLPASFRPVSFSFGQQRHDFMERSDATGAEAARLLAPPQWTCGVQSADHMTLSEAGTWEAWLLKLRGGVNVAAIYDPVRRQPEGTLRGSPVLGLAAAAGDTSVTIGACTGANKLRFVSNYNNAYWTRTRATVTSNATTGVDGTASADKLIEDSTASSSHYVNSTYVTASTLPTIGIELKADTRTRALLQGIRDSGTGVASGALLVDLSGGTIVSGTGTITALGSGWYAVSVTCTTVATTNYGLRLQLDNGATQSYTGDGTSGLFLGRSWLSETAHTTFPGYETVEAGDALQLSTGVGTSQLVKVTEDATATAFGEAVWQTGGGAQAIWSGSGGQATWSDDGSPGESMTVTFEPPLRMAFAKDTAVSWDKPVAYYRMQGNPKWQYSTRSYRREGGFAADFVETFN